MPTTTPIPVVTIPVVTIPVPVVVAPAPVVVAPAPVVPVPAPVVVKAVVVAPAPVVVAPVAKVTPPTLAVVVPAPGRRILTPNSLFVFSVNDLGKSITLSGNTIVLPKGAPTMGKIVAINVPAGATSALLRAATGEVIAGYPTLTIAPGQEVILRCTAIGYDVLVTLGQSTLPTPSVTK